MRLPIAALVLALAGCVTMARAQAPAVEFNNVVEAMQALPEYNGTFSVVTFLDLQNDTSFAWKQFRTTIYSPTNEVGGRGGEF
jgi:hypothetical protein